MQRYSTSALCFPWEKEGANAPGWYSRTFALAEKLHEGQTDKRGEPYIWHLSRTALRVADIFSGPRPWIEAALLHDSIEDTPANPGDLLAAGLSPEVVRIVEAVTKPEGMRSSGYLAWIESIAHGDSLGAKAVKAADLLDNSDPLRSAPNWSERALTKYAPARAILLPVLGLAAE